MKEQIIVFVKSNYSTITLVILCMVIMFLWQSTVNKQKEINSLNASMNVSKTIESIEQKLESVKINEMNTYKMLHDKLQLMEDARLKLEEQERKLNKPDIERNNENVKNLSLEEVNLLLRSLGYDTNINDCK